MPVGSLLELQRRRVDVIADEVYQEIGVRSFGKGLFIKEPGLGAELGDKRVFEIRAGDFIVSNVFAWEGAVSVAGPEHEGMIGSHRFMTWTPREDISTDYLRHYFGSEAGVASLASASPGSAGRNRTLSIKNFEQVQVPVPSRPDQDRIAAHLTAVADRAAHSSTRAQGSVDSVVSSWLDSLPQRLLGELVEVCPRPMRLAPESLIDFVPMEAVDAVTGSITGAVQRTRGELSSGYRQFLPGDVIFARITPSMQNGKCAIYDGNGAGVGYGSTEFHVLRPRDPRYRQWIWALLRTQWFISRAMAAFTGTAGQQRVPASFLEQVRVPTPALPQLEGAIRRLLEVRERVNAMNDVARRRDELARVVLPAARNRLFSVMR